MSDQLPSRGGVSGWLHDPERASAISRVPTPYLEILEAFVSEELMTAAEWREAIDYEAAEKITLKARAAIAAAIGDTPSTITSADWFNRDDNTE